MLEHRWVLLEEGGEVVEGVEGVGAKVVLNALDVARLGFGVQPEECKKTGEDGVAVTDTLGYGAALVGKGESTIFFVAQVAGVGELLHHAGDAGLTDPQGLGNVGNVRGALALDQFVDALKVVLGTLAGFSGHAGGYAGGRCGATCILLERQGARA